MATVIERPAGEADPAVARRAKIVCTVGPSSAAPERIVELVAAGMDVARLNFSHAGHAFHAEVYGDVRAASDSVGRAVGVLADLQGPKLRIGLLAGGAAVLTVLDRAMVVLGRAQPGDAVVVVAGTPPGTEASTNTLRVHRLAPR